MCVFAFLPLSSRYPAPSLSSFVALHGPSWFRLMIAWKSVRCTPSSSISSKEIRITIRRHTFLLRHLASPSLPRHRLRTFPRQGSPLACSCPSSLFSHPRRRQGKVRTPGLHTHRHGCTGREEASHREGRILASCLFPFPSRAFHRRPSSRGCTHLGILLHGRYPSEGQSTARRRTDRTRVSHRHDGRTGRRVRLRLSRWLLHLL